MRMGMCALSLFLLCKNGRSEKLENFFVFLGTNLHFLGTRGAKAFKFVIIKIEIMFYIRESSSRQLVSRKWVEPYL